MPRGHSTSALLVLAACLLGCGGAGSRPRSVAEGSSEDVTGARADRSLDLESSEGRRAAFLLTRGSTDPTAEVVFYFSGHIYADIPPSPNAPPEHGLRRPLLRFEGYNIARFVPTDSGDRRMLSREVTFYEDLEGRIVDCWVNPLTGDPVSVAHVWNDPVSFTLGDVDGRRQGGLVVFRVEVSLSYPSPLTVADHPLFAASDTYQSTELFDFFVEIDELTDPSVTSAEASLVWTRVGQWVPWMQMRQRPGRLIYHAVGRKLSGGFDDLPAHVRERVLREVPAFAGAPESDTEGPNATSWTRFRELLGAGRYQERCNPG